MIKIYENQGIYKVLVNNPFPPINFPFEGKESNKMLSEMGLSIVNGNQQQEVIIEKPLDLKEHIVGLGEKAFELDRKRGRYLMFNVDAGAYRRYQDPLYLNIPFFISVKDGKATGYFFNSASKVVFDVGLEEYDRVKVIIPEDSLEFFVFEGPTIEDVLEKYTKITGNPFLPPIWAFEYMISRYSYYPQDKVLELVDLMQKDGFKVSGIFLDIHFMDSYKLFTWHPKRFPEPKKLIEELHKRGVKLVTIVDHSVRADQNYPVFISGLGKYCELDTGELFVGNLWPGPSVFPDFFKEDTREWWANLIAEWLSQGIDGIWLDMNEPTDFSTVRKYEEVYSKAGIKFDEDRKLLGFPPNVVHWLRGRKVYHEKVRNAYPLYEAMATFEGFKKAGRDEVFILSRSGYAGIQKYAFVWTGDNTPSWEDLKLQLQLLLGLSVSGVPYVGFDIGGFQGREFDKVDNSLELLVRYYYVALFSPFFRSHKATNGIDTEPVFLPSYYKERIRRAIETRYKFLPYLYSLAVEASEKGHPIIRPLFYEFPEDDMFRIEDEYMVGKFILYAPLVERENTRTVILPKGKWYDYWSGKTVEGIVKSTDELPIYVREESVIPLDGNEWLVFGNSSFTRYDGVTVISTEHKITFSRETFLSSITIVNAKKVKANGKEYVSDNGKFRINEKVNEIEVEYS